MLKKKIYLLMLFVVLGVVAQAQTGIRVAVDKDGTPIYRLSEVLITAQRSGNRDKNRHNRQIKKFNKLRYNILKVLPYANEASNNLKIIDRELQNIPTEEGKQAYLDSREKFLFGKYEEDVRDLTISQGKVLVKLIDRQTGNSAYSLISDYKSKTSAFFWQSIGSVFGYNLKEHYDPEDEFAMEVILKSIENGKNPTYYDYLEAKNASGK